MTNAANNGERLSTLLGTCIIPAALECAGMTDPSGLEAFLRSGTFALLSDAATGMWHLSPQTIAEIFTEELASGMVITPEEQS